MPVIYSRVPKFFRRPGTQGPAFELDDDGDLQPTMFDLVTPEAFEEAATFQLRPSTGAAEDPLWELDTNGDWMPKT